MCKNQCLQIPWLCWLCWKDQYTCPLVLLFLTDDFHVKVERREYAENIDSQFNGKCIYCKGFCFRFPQEKFSSKLLMCQVSHMRTGSKIVKNEITLEQKVEWTWNSLFLKKKVILCFLQKIHCSAWLAIKRATEKLLKFYLHENEADNFSGSGGEILSSILPSPTRGKLNVFFKIMPFWVTSWLFKKVPYGYSFDLQLWHVHSHPLMFLQYMAPLFW